jgi:hypothetical protein
LKGSSVFSTGIAKYEVAIGTYPGAQDIMVRASVGDATAYLASNLTLAPGATYFGTVWATDYLGMAVGWWN